MSTKWNSETAWELADIVGRSYAIMADLSDRVAAAEGTTSSRMVALAVLDAFPEGLSQTDWGRYQAVSRQRASILAREFKAEGLIRSVPQGRKATVSLTAKGRRCVQHHKELFGGAMKAKLDDFSTQDGKDLIRLVGNLISSIERSNDLE